eukprot:2358262-Prymnesium_polylepis.1
MKPSYDASRGRSSVSRHVQRSISSTVLAQPPGPVLNRLTSQCALALPQLHDRARLPTLPMPVPDALDHDDLPSEELRLLVTEASNEERSCDSCGDSRCDSRCDDLPAHCRGKKSAFRN